MFKKIMNLLLIIVLGYMAIALCLFLFQKNILFQPEKLRNDHTLCNPEDCEEVWITTEDGVRINGLYYEGKRKGVILYLHGNAGSLRTWRGVYHSFREFERSMLIIDYRSYGKSEGEISEKGLNLDADAAYTWLLNRKYTGEDIIIFGRSIGTPMAIELAAKRAHQALILESPFTDLATLASTKMPIFPVRSLLKYKFDSSVFFDQLKQPTMIIYGANDALIPGHFSKSVYELIKGPKKLLEVPGAGHNNIELHPAFTEQMKRFLESL